MCWYESGILFTALTCIPPLWANALMPVNGAPAAGALLNCIGSEQSRRCAALVMKLDTGLDAVQVFLGCS